jgi:hypothetical protein
MFRVVTEHQAKRSCLLLCDNRKCGTCATADLEPDADQTEAATAFVHLAVGAGWLMGLDAHLCPQCAAAARQQENRIQVARSLAVLN